jgi:hypothetical protein
MHSHYVFSSLFGRITPEGFLSMILICLIIGHVLLRVSLPSNTLLLWLNTLYIQQVFIFFKEVCDNLSFLIGSQIWSKSRCIFVIHPKWMFYVRVLKGLCLDRFEIEFHRICANRIVRESCSCSMMWLLHLFANSLRIKYVVSKACHDRCHILDKFDSWVQLPNIRCMFHM